MLPLEQTKKCRNSQGSSTKGRSSLGNLASTKIRFGPLNSDFGGFQLCLRRLGETKTMLIPLYTMKLGTWDSVICNIQHILLSRRYYHIIKRTIKRDVHCMCIHTCTKYKTPVPLCTVPQAQVPTSHRDHGETEDNGTTSLIRPQPRRLFLGLGSLTRTTGQPGVVSLPLILPVDCLLAVRILLLMSDSQPPTTNINRTGSQRVIGWVCLDYVCIRSSTTVK